MLCIQKYDYKIFGTEYNIIINYTDLTKNSFLLNKFPKLSNDEARDILTYWMETFGDENR